MSTFDPARLAERIGELESAMAEPGFWDDARGAAKQSAEHARLSKRLQRYESLTSELTDVSELLALASEDDELAELATALEPLKAELAALEEAAIFQGEYDSGSAVVTIHAGTGGDRRAGLDRDAAPDVLALGCGEGLRHGGARDLPGRGGGAEVGNVYCRRRERLRDPPSRARCPQAGATSRPSMRRAGAIRSFAQVIVSPLVTDDIDIDIDEADLRIDTYRASGAGGQHVNKTDSAVRITHVPSGIVVQCQAERSQLSNRDTAMQLLRSRLVEAELKRREEELAAERGERQDADFGSQIRSYVLHPYQLVKDHRTGIEEGNTQAVLDGRLDELIRGYLLANAAQRAN